MISEDAIIHYLKHQFSSHIGDDAACIDGTNGQQYVITKDLLIEDVHFRTRYASPESIAHKALHVNLSDLAAMGAKPAFVLLGLSIPEHYFGSVEKFLKAFTKHCKINDVVLIGGDTTKSPDKFFISITAIGVSNPQTTKRRDTAQCGDIICVCGTLGDSHLGLIALEKNLPHFDDFKTAFLLPKARLIEGQWLSQRGDVTAMMDISDGFITDLKKLCLSSNVGATLNLDFLEFSDTYFNSCKKLELDPYQTALIGGEDYGLLFTVNEKKISTLTNAFFQTFHYPLKKLGVITNTKNIEIIKNNKPFSLQERPFTHFGESV